MIAELVNWLRRSLTSREITYAARYFNREFGRTRSGGVKYSQELIRQAEGQLSLDIGDLVSACSTEADVSQKVQALSKSDKFAYRCHVELGTHRIRDPRPQISGESGIPGPKTTKIWRSPVPKSPENWGPLRRIRDPI